jgi:hypothetical protein
VTQREGDIHRYTNAESIAPDAPLVDLTERGVRAVVNDAIEDAGLA